MVASGDPMSKQAGYENIDEFTRNFNSDLKDTKNVMTPDA